MTDTRKLFAALALAALSFGAAACNKTPTTPTDPTTNTPSTTIVSDAIAPLGSSFSSFQVAATTNVSVTLVSLTSSTGVPLSTQVTIGLGTIDATGCAIPAATTVQTVPGFVAQINVSEPVGLYCAKIVDTGNLPDSATFTLRIVTTVGTVTPVGSAGAETFSSVIGPSGAVGHTVYASASGNLTLTVLSVDKATGPMGLSLGVWDDTNQVCRLLSSTASAIPSTQIVLPVDTGFYCFKLFDVGNLPAISPFSIAVAHP